MTRSAPIAITEDDAQILERLSQDGPGLVDETVRWAQISSGSYNLRGLTDMAATLLPVLEALPGSVEQLALAPIETVLPDGTQTSFETGPALKLTVRPDAPARVVLTGHYDNRLSRGLALHHGDKTGGRHPQRAWNGRYEGGPLHHARRAARVREPSGG